MALINLRETAEQKGLKVDWAPDKGPMINGNPINPQGLINYGNAPEEGYSPNTYYGTQEQVDQILQPYLTMPPPGNNTPAVSSGGLVSLRDIAEQKGLAVTWDPQKGAMINGIPVNTGGLQNFGQTPPTGYQADTFYGTPDQINQILQPYVVPEISPDVDKAHKDYQEWAKTDYAAKYAPELESLVKDVLSRQFNYDPANDAQFQKAAQELTRNVMESMNARGILNSTITQNQVQQGVANMMPDYENLARQRFQDEGKVLMSQVDMLLGLDETDYNRYQDEGKRYAEALDFVMQMDKEKFKRWQEAYTQSYNLAKDKIEAEQTALENKRKDVEDAWDRVNELDYVDNAAAIILGVKPGTPSKSAREYYRKRADELADSATKQQQQLDLIEAEYQKQSKLAKEKAELEIKNVVFKDVRDLKKLVDDDGNPVYTDEMLLAYINMQPGLTESEKEEIIKSAGIKKPTATVEEPMATEQADNSLDGKLKTMNNPEQMGYLIAKETADDTEFFAKLKEYGIKYENGEFSWITEE